MRKDVELRLKAAAVEMQSAAQDDNAMGAYSAHVAIVGLLSALLEEVAGLRDDLAKTNSR